MAEEARLERKLCREVIKRGGMADKFLSPGKTGVPDRILFLPGGRVVLVEMKAPGMKPRPLQLRRHMEYRGVGVPVYVVDSDEGITRLIEELFGGGDADGVHSS